MEPEAYKITKTVSGFIEGEVLNVTSRDGYNQMELELDPFAADPVRVVVTDRSTGFSERNILDASTRIGAWHEYARTFAAGGEPVGNATAADGPVEITMDDLSSIAEPVGTLS